MSQPENSSTPSRHSRRAVLAAAPAVPAAGLLAGCGGSDSGGDPSAPASAPGSSAPGSGSGGVTVATSQVPVGGGYVDKSAKVVVTQPVAGTYKAFGAVCPHEGCLVSRVADGQIVCPCHGSRFDVTGGDVVAGPAQEGLPSRTVTVSGTTLTIT